MVETDNFTNIEPQTAQRWKCSVLFDEEYSYEQVGHQQQATRRLYGNFVNFCRLWIKFLEILRHHWEYNLDLPYFGTDERPQLVCCLLHQKLQMTLLLEESGMSFRMKSFSMQTNPLMRWRRCDFPERPSGRSHPLNSNECLRNYPKERIFVPFTQDEGPMTEDQIEQMVSVQDFDRPSFRKLGVWPMLVRLHNSNAFSTRPEKLNKFFMKLLLYLQLVSVHMAEILLENDCQTNQDLARTLRMVEEMVMKYSTTFNLMLRQVQFC
ncbi:hypothetical protein GPALN_014614 [Globodera pallida]|nr:hypothetical protein GPALN_014614 [Globodera pallida]